MLSIGEFSKACGLTVKTLRFYHDRGLLIPAAIDSGSGYRYYDQRNLETAQVIRALRDFEFPLDEIAAILNECGECDDLIGRLEQHRSSLADKAGHYQSLVHRLDQAIQQERRAQQETSMQQQAYKIEERVIEAQLIAGTRMTGKYSDCGQCFAKLGKRIGRHITGKASCLFYDGEYREDDAEFEPCFPISRAVDAEGLDVRTLEGARCVTLVHRGPYETLRRSYARAMEHVKQRGYDIDLPTREVYIKGPGMFFRGNPEKYLTEIQLPIKE